MAFALLTSMQQSANAGGGGGNCYHIKQEKSKVGPNDFRVRAHCSSLRGDQKARGTLDVRLDTDKHTSWFTTRNKYYYSGYRACVWGCSTRVEIRSV